MANTGTIRTNQALLDLWADNSKADISAQDGRDFIATQGASLPLVPAEAYGVVADGITDNADALDSIETADVAVQFPVGTIKTSRTWFPTKGFRGFGRNQTTIQAIDPWLGSKNRLIDLSHIQNAGQEFSNIELSANNSATGCKHTVATSAKAAGTGSPRGEHIWTSVLFHGAASGGYLLYFPKSVSTTSSELVGNLFLNTSYNANQGAGLVHLGIAADDVTFINSRMAWFSNPTVSPIFIESVDVTFITTFLQPAGDTDSSIDHAIKCTSGGSHRQFLNLFVEPALVSTYVNWKYLFRFTLAPQTTINGVHLEGEGFTLPTGWSFAVVECGASSGQLEVRNVNNGFRTIGGENLFAIENSSTQGAIGSIIDIAFSGVDRFDTLATNLTANATTFPRVQFNGTYKGNHYSHKYFADNLTDWWLSEQPSVSTVSTLTANKHLVFEDAFKHIRMNVATSGAIIVPASATVPFAAGTEINFINRNAADLNIASSAGVTVNGSAVFAQNHAGKLLRTDVGDEWDLIRFESG